MSLFGNNQSKSLFGNQNSGTGLFGNAGNNNQTSGTGLFGNSGNNNQTSGTSLFGNNNQTSGTSLFGNNNQTSGTGLFGNNVNNQNLNQQISSSSFFTSVEPVIALNHNNDLRNITLNKLPEKFQNAAIILKLNLKNQKIKLDELKRYSQRLMVLIDQNNKSAEKLGEFNDFINQKLNKYNDIVNQVKDNFNSISESFEEEQKNIKLIEQDSGYKIEIPSKFLLNYSQNLLNRTVLFQKRLNDIITLIKLYYSQSNNDFNFDSDIMESTIAEFIKIVRYLLESNARQEKMINEMLHTFLQASKDKGYNPQTVYNNIMQYTLESNSNSA